MASEPLRDYPGGTGGSMLLALLALAACSDYQLNSKTHPNEGVDDTDSGGATGDGSGVDECPDLDVSRSSVATDETCQVDAKVGTFTPVIEWTFDPDGSDAYTTPAVGELTDDNGDGKIDASDMPDVAFATSSGTLYVVSGDGSGKHWSVGGLGSEPSSPAIGDIDSDGKPDVVIAWSDYSTGRLTAYDGATGALKWQSDPVLGGLPICGGVGIYDLDGDGNPEVVIGKWIFRGKTGKLRGAGSYGAGTGYSSGGFAAFGVAADVDGDGKQEVVVGNALYDADGNTIWQNGKSDGFVALGNFDSDDKAEIVVAWSGNVRLQDDDGTVLWSDNYTGATVGPPTVADFDGDGKPEIGVAGHNVYAVIETNGKLKWKKPVQDESSGFTGSSVFDFEGDGKAEVVYADENDVWVFDGATGDVKLQESQHSSATCSEYPSIADVDNDGHAEILYTSSQYSGSEHGLRVIGDADDSWMPGRPVWNQHSYSITNVDDDASIPKSPAQNWLTYNNFRSGDVTAATGSKSANAVPMLGDICDVECDHGHLYVVTRVGNGGMDDLPAGVPMTMYAEQAGDWVALGTQTTSKAIAPGDTTLGIEWDLDPASVPDGKLRFVVDDDGTGAGTVDECHEDDNVLDIDEGLCP